MITLRWFHRVPDSNAVCPMAHGLERFRHVLVKLHVSLPNHTIMVEIRENSSFSSFLWFSSASLSSIFCFSSSFLHFSFTSLSFSVPLEPSFCTSIIKSSLLLCHYAIKFWILLLTLSGTGHLLMSKSLLHLFLLDKLKKEMESALDFIQLYSWSTEMQVKNNNFYLKRMLLPWLFYFVLTPNFFLLRTFFKELSQEMKYWVSFTFQISKKIKQIKGRGVTRRYSSSSSDYVEPL